MPYLFLFLSVFAGISKGFCGKRISGFTAEFKSAAYSNFIRMLLCVFIGFCFVLFDGGIVEFVPTLSLLIISALSGLTTAMFVVFWLFAVRKGAYVLVDVFLTLGTLISAILSIIFYDAEFTLFDGVGFALLFIAAIVMCSYSAQIKTKISITALLLLVIVAVANGVSDFTKEIFNRELGHKYSASTFNFYTFLFSAIALFFAYLFSKDSKESKENIKNINSKGMLYIILMSICLFLNSFFKTLASRDLDMTLVAPLSQGAALILITVMSAIFFGEKIKPRCVVGVILAITGLMIMNFI